MNTHISRKSEFSLIATFVFFVFFIQLGLILPSIIYGFYYENLECQKGTRGGLNLSDWNKGFGLEKLFVNMFFLLSSILFIYTKIDERFLFAPLFVLFFDILFNIVWWIWGVVILATRENNLCVKEGRSISIFSIVNLWLCPFWNLHLSYFRNN